MTFQVSGDAGRKVRPGAVGAATIVLYGLAATILAQGALGVILVVGYGVNPAADVFAAQQGADAARSFETFGGVIAGVLFAAVAAAVIVLAVLDGKGRNPARITTWVVAGIFALCCGCKSIGGLAGQALLNSGLDSSRPTVPQLASREPGWITATDTALALVAMLLAIAAIVLLAVPASNDFFRKEQAVWVPPGYPSGYGAGYGYAPGAAYPQPPQVPQYPYPPAPPAPPRPPEYPGGPPAPPTPPPPTPPPPTPPPTDQPPR